LLGLFWLINDLAERAVDAAGRAVGPARGASSLAGAAGRRVTIVVMYALLGAISLFELFPIYFVVVTAFKSELQIQQVRGMFWPDPWTLADGADLHAGPEADGGRADGRQRQRVGRSRCRRRNVLAPLLVSDSSEDRGHKRATRDRM
jgi:hypothetical protein